MMKQLSGSPILVLKQNTKRDTGRKAQLANIQAGKTIADVVRTTLGPKSMLKMLLDPMGGIVITNDGNAILREVDVGHPAAKWIIDISRAQDEEVGDGTTSVVVLCGELLSLADPLIRANIHPSTIVYNYLRVLEDTMKELDKLTIKLDINDTSSVTKAINSCLSSKFSSRWGDVICKLAMAATKIVLIESPSGRKEIDLKRYAKVEKIAGGEVDDCCVLDGVMVNKDVTHAKMRRYITNPKILLLDCPLEYKKGESQTNVEITKEEDWMKLLQQEELEVMLMCEHIKESGCNVVVTEKGVSDLAQHFLVRANISVLRRVRKSDNNRIARVSGATIVNRTEEINQSDVGTKCGLFEIKRIGDEYYAFFVECKQPKACTILLRGASKDVLNEIERNLNDAMGAARNIYLEPKLLPGGGATEMEIAARLKEKIKDSSDKRELTFPPYHAAVAALEVIPRTLAQNCGCNVVRVIADLRSKHSLPNGEGKNWGINGETGEITDITELGIWDTFSVKQQVLKSSIETAALLLRIDDVVSGITRKENRGGAPEGGQSFEQGENYANAMES